MTIDNRFTDIKQAPEVISTGDLIRLYFETGNVVGYALKCFEEAKRMPQHLITLQSHDPTNRGSLPDHLKDSECHFGTFNTNTGEFLSGTHKVGGEIIMPDRQYLGSTPVIAYQILERAKDRT